VCTFLLHDNVPIVNLKILKAFNKFHSIFSKYKIYYVYITIGSVLLLNFFFFFFNDANPPYSVYKVSIRTFPIAIKRLAC